MRIYGPLERLPLAFLWPAWHSTACIGAVWSCVNRLRIAPVDGVIPY